MLGTEWAQIRHKKSQVSNHYLGFALLTGAPEKMEVGTGHSKLSFFSNDFLKAKS